MEIKNAFINISSKIEGIRFCAFDQQIVFGKCQLEKFDEKKCFLIEIPEIPELFTALFHIVKTFSTVKEGDGILLKKRSSDITYLWKVAKCNEEAQVFLKTTKNDQLFYELQLSILQFNDLIFLLGALILPSLNLKEKTLKIFSLILDLELDQILKFRQTKLLNQFLDKFKKVDEPLSAIEIHFTAILIQYHLDILVAIHCIKSLYNVDLNITNKNIEFMLSCQ